MTAVSWKFPGTPGSWTTAADWSNGTIPDGTFAVTLGEATNAYTVTLNSAVSVTSVDIGSAAGSVQTELLLSGGSLTTTAGISLKNSASLLAGSGTIANTGNISGSGTLESSGGTLEITGNISSGVALAANANSTLQLDGTAATTGITFNSAGSIVDAEGKLTIASAQTINSGATLQLSGGTLTDSSGITVATGGALTGFGTVAANTDVEGAGTVTAASGGVLEFNGSVDSTGSLGFTIANGGDLKFDDVVGGASSPTIAFASGAGTLDLTGEARGSGASGEVTQFHGVVSGLQSGDVIDVAGASGDSLLLSNNNVLEVVHGAHNTVEESIQLGAGNYSLSDFSLANNGTTDTITATAAICFLAGTLIRTPDGEVAVETLKRGDMVRATDGRDVPVTWLGVQTVSMRFADPLRVLPIRIRAGALDENVPSRDLLLSPDHALLVDGALIHAGALVNGASITRVTAMPETFVYYHVEADDHALIFAEGAPAETFVDNVDRLNFDNWAEHLAAYPDGKTIEELPYPRAKAHRQVPMAVRVRLAERAQAIGAAMNAAA